LSGRVSRHSLATQPETYASLGSSVFLSITWRNPPTLDLRPYGPWRRVGTRTWRFRFFIEGQRMRVLPSRRSCDKTNLLLSNFPSKAEGFGGARFASFFRLRLRRSRANGDHPARAFRRGSHTNSFTLQWNAVQLHSLPRGLILSNFLDDEGSASHSFFDIYTVGQLSEGARPDLPHRKGNKDIFLIFRHAPHSGVKIPSALTSCEYEHFREDGPYGA